MTKSFSSYFIASSVTFFCTYLPILLIPVNLFAKDIKYTDVSPSSFIQPFRPHVTITKTSFRKRQTLPLPMRQALMLEVKILIIEPVNSSY